MPGFVTHYLFGVDAYKMLPANSIKKNLRKNHCAFALGLQGPDVFFYCPYSHLFHDRNIGDLAHSKNTGTFFYHLMKSRLLFDDNRKKQAIADAYLTGFIGHYSLDCTAHPYVYAFTGYNAQTPPSVVNYFGQHTYLETEIDNEILFAKKQLLPTEFFQNKTIALTALQRSVISKMLAYAYRNTYPDYTVTELEVKFASICMFIGTGLLRDTTGQKKVAVRFTEKVFLGKPLISPMVASDFYQFVPDPLNLAHRTWIHPWTFEPSEDSFINLYNQAQSLYNMRIVNFYGIIDEGFTPEGIKEFMKDYGHISFLSGIEL